MAKQALPAATVKELIDDAFTAAAAVSSAIPVVGSIAPPVLNAAKAIFDANWPQIETWLQNNGWVTP